MAPLNAVNEQKPREIAVRVLQQQRASGRFIEDLLENALSGASLSSADRALCQEVTYGMVRWQAALDWLIARKTNGREQKPALQNLLRLGLYQIFWLDRIPDHAAVHETVELAKHNGLGAQAGFVNAILRGYLRETGATEKLLTELKVTQPATGWSHPEWLVARWQSRWGRDRTAQLLQWNNLPPKTYARVNTLKTDAGRLLEKWRAENVEYDFVRSGGRQTAASLAETEASGFLPKAATFENLVFELKAHPPLNSLASFRDGWFYIQDPSTLLAVAKLDPQPGETVLDFCAAPGGKTTFIAQLMNNQGRIIAQDISEDRLKLIRENCGRLGVTCVEPLLASALDPRPPTFDRILVDAPCSNTGVMRRRVDLRWRIQPAEIERLRSDQLNLLKQAAPQVKSGGVLVYSTCSLEPEENGGVVQLFLGEHADFKLESEHELLPFTDTVDGAYVARLVRAPITSP